jgi:hypothetical protein
MEEEVFAGLILGAFLWLPVGWFLRSALQWRREARRVEHPVVQQVVQPAPPPESRRLELLLERLVHRVESVEERIDFTEQLLDSRSSVGNQSRRDPAAQR